MSWSELCGMYGQSASDPDALDNILDSIHMENMSGLLDAYLEGDDTITREEAEEAAIELGWDNLNDFMKNGVE